MCSVPRETARSKRSLVLLALGATTGIGLALAAILAPPRPAESVGDVVATVNARPIRRAAYDRALAGLAADLERAPTARERRRVLDRLIEEELLVQRGLTMELPAVDPKLRGDLVAVVIDSIVANAETSDADPAAVRAFYDRNKDYFAKPGRFAVREIFFSAYGGEEAAARRAEQASARLAAGESFADVAAESGDEQVARLPRGFAAAETLRDALGPTAFAATMALEPGEHTPVVRSGAGFHLVELVDRLPTQTPPFEEIEALVAAEYRRREGETALRRTLDDLREEADVRVSGSMR